MATGLHPGSAAALGWFQISRAATGKPAAFNKRLDSALGAAAGVFFAGEVFHARPFE